ncbi:hypothetical protein H5410_030288 [Solanum commersonii]|uniref:Uncharacterized protein n=1 Tax=Solanum commersonii TaxID=4109 RepID=A0A9J5YIW3_SOLCO|nr:hypothetical protein H5410_030288 [Solanum commersonii]
MLPHVPIVPAQGEGIASEFAMISTQVALRAQPFTAPPSSAADLAKEVLVRYSNFTEEERIKKLMIHERYLSKKVDEKEERIEKIEKMNEEKEMEILFNQLVEGKNIAELTAREIQGDGNNIDSAPIEGDDISAEDNGHSKDLD